MPSYHIEWDKRFFYVVDFTDGKTLAVFYTKARAKAHIKALTLESVAA